MLNPLIKRRVTVKKIALLLLAGASLLSTNVAAQEVNVPASEVTRSLTASCPTCRVRACVQCSLNTVYKAGESWTEMPGDHHKVSANASSTKPARLLAIFIVDTTEQELVIPDK